MLTLITLVQFTVFFGYVYYIYNRYGKLTSISASSDYLPRKERWKFAAFLCIVGTLNVFQEMGMYGVLAMAGLWYSGITLRHGVKKSSSYYVHIIGTVGAIVATFLGLWVLHGMWLPTITLAVAIALLYRDKYFIWWVEIIAMMLVISAYLLR